LASKTVTVLDFPRLKEVAQYDANYLHLLRTEMRDSPVSERLADLVPASARGRLHQVAASLKHPFAA
jgi:hypothetical protein